jgi:hypothetical protein
MSLYHKYHAPNPALGSHLNRSALHGRLSAAKFVAALAIFVVALGGIFAAGHPILATWVGGASICLMFFAGASGAHGGQSERVGSSFILPLSLTQEAEASARREAIYREMCRGRGLEPQNPMPY